MDLLNPASHGKLKAFYIICVYAYTEPRASNPMRHADITDDPAVRDDPLPRWQVREHPTKGVWVDGLTESYVTTVDEVMDLLKQGEHHRHVAATAMNSASSRSHSVFMISVQQKFKDGSTKAGKLCLADLAGSEKVKRSKVEGEGLAEAAMINKSLSALGNCINALTEKGRAHIPYRDSKLTYILRESLGGNSRTTLMVRSRPRTPPPRAGRRSMTTLSPSGGVLPPCRLL